MVYDFSHYRRPRIDGVQIPRRVRFCIDEQDFPRAVALAYGRVARPFGSWSSTQSGDSRCVDMDVAGARILVDVLSELGGDAAVSGRMLCDFLDGMAAELLESRRARRRSAA